MCTLTGRHGISAGRIGAEAVDFRARPGEVVAFVGHTGAGKTHRQSDPAFLRVTAALSRSMVMTFVMCRSTVCAVRSVLCCRIRSYSPITVLKTSATASLRRPTRRSSPPPKMVAAHDFIETVTGWLSDCAGRTRSGLSQGQRQLIAIARVALMNPNI